MEQRLPKEKLYFLCELPAVQQYVLESDYAFYQALVQVLIPDVLRPIPGMCRVACVLARAHVRARVFEM